MHDRDAAAKILLPLVGVSLLVGLLAIGGHMLIDGKLYTIDFCVASNNKAGFYPYIPPVAKAPSDQSNRGRTPRATPREAPHGAHGEAPKEETEQ